MESPRGSGGDRPAGGIPEGSPTGESPALPQTAHPQSPAGPRPGALFPPPRVANGTDTGHPAASPAAQRSSAQGPPPQGDGGPQNSSGQNSSGGGETGRRWSLWSVGALVVAAVGLTGAMLTHLAMIFLNAAPPNAVSIQNRRRINAYVYPEFGQRWKLFAPNPSQLNEAFGFRVRTRGRDGTRHTSGWVNLTYRDIKAIRGNPAPSHVHQYMLRHAWDGYVSSHTRDERPRSPRGVLAAAYLKRVVLQRAGRERQGEPVIGVQVGGRFTRVPPPSWSLEGAQGTTTYRILPWWPVTDQDYRGL